MDEDLTLTVHAHKTRTATLVRRSCAAAAAIALALWLAACGGTEAAGTFTPRTPGTLVVATAEIPEPGFWYGSAQHPTGGFEYELARALAAHLGLARVRVVVVPFPRLTAGHLDDADLALSDITVTAQRARHLSFSTSYLAAPPAIVVRPGTQVADMYAAQRLRWAVQHGTTLQSELEGTIRPNRTPLVVPHQVQALAALRARRVQAVLLDLPVALAYAREAPRTYAVAAQLPREDVLAAALPKGSENIEAVEPVLVLASSGPFRARAARAHLTKAAAVAGVDGTISTVLDRSVLHGALHTGLATEATLVLVAEPADLNEGERDTARALLADAPPVALVHGSASGIGAVRILTHTLDDTSSSLAAEMARRVARGPADRIEDGNGDWSALLAPEDVTFVSSADTRALLTPPQDLPGIVVTTLDRPSAQ